MPPPSLATRRTHAVSVPTFAAASPLPAEALAELRGETGFAAWQVLRSVTLWVGVPQPDRGGLFDAAYLAEWERRLLESRLEPEARLPLAVIVREMAVAQPGAGQLPWACICAADWALGVGARRAALAFAEAAAFAAPASPRYAWLAGRLLRTHGEPLAAERWLRQALRLAVEQGDGDTQARALLALGGLSVQQGRIGEARTLHTRALRVSRRLQLREHASRALHELFVVATLEGDRAEAERCAAAALDAGAGLPQSVAALAADLARWWLEQGHPHRALAVYQALRPHLAGVTRQLPLLADIARAAAACGDRCAFEATLRETLQLRARYPADDAVPAALLALARGAASLQEWGRAGALADEAAETARLRGDAGLIAAAAALREVVARRELPAPAEGAGGASASGERLAAAVVAALMSAGSAEGAQP